MLFCSKLVGLTPVLFGCIQSVITVRIILRYTVSYSKGETLSEDQSGPWSTAIEQLYLVRRDNGSWEGRIQFNYTRLLCDVRCPSGRTGVYLPQKNILHFQLISLLAAARPTYVMSLNFGFVRTVVKVAILCQTDKQTNTAF